MTGRQHRAGRSLSVLNGPAK